MMHRNIQGIAFEQPQGQEHICTPSGITGFFLNFYAAFERSDAVL
jgi:hypothetical protein